MRKTRSREKQTNLFHPERKGPEWEELPQKVREDVRKLMADLVLSHLAKPVQSLATDAEEGDE